MIPGFKPFTIVINFGQPAARAGNF